ncbi:MAG: 30S ribosomal protein S2 [Bryobacteraceae bacterium]|nr:30S ribosomal protein S2 [Solibacteraceae bacterium]MCL4840334.1 30S ribosomal protein S2 [Bryobacteraceae bacterium]
MPTITMKELLEAGVHFGHQTRRWNPKMKEYIFGERNGIYIIDLQKTQKLFKDAMQYVARQAAMGKTILFVGTKRQAQEAIMEEATRCGMYYVNNRWLGGLLTNFVTVKQSIKRLKDLEAVLDEGAGERRTKKELIGMERERKNLMQNLAGIKEMADLPDMLFVIDSHKESIAVQEAKKLGIPVVAVVDTNCDPDDVTWPIPGNDDALRAIKLFASKISDAMLEGRELASEHDFATAEAAAPVEDDSVDMSQYAQYVDPRLNEDVLTEGISDLDLPSVSLPKKQAEPEAEAAPAEAEAEPAAAEPEANQ